jgi:hypothetical protein
MSGKITGAGFPLDGRIWITAAEFSGVKFHRPLASFALLHDGVAGAAVVAASGFGHEGALDSRLHSCTNHDNHPLFWYYYFSPAGTGKTLRDDNRELIGVKDFCTSSCNFT